MKPRQDMPFFHLERMCNELAWVGRSCQGSKYVILVACEVGVDSIPFFTGGWKHPVREPGRDVGGHGMLDEIWRASPSLMRQLFQDYGGVHHPLVQMMAFPKAK